MKFITLFTLVIIINFSSGLNIECDFKMLSGKSEEFYSCVTQGLVTDEFTDYVEEVNGPHIEGKTNEDVLNFYVVDQEAEYFPGGLSHFFPNLKAITIKNSSLKYIFKSDMSEHQKITFLDVSSNEIETIGSKVFEENPLLEEIHLERNKLSKISDDLLDSLESDRQVIFLFDNVCIKTDLSLPKPSLKEIKELIKENCPLTKEDEVEISQKQFEKLIQRIKSLESSKNPEKDPKEMEEKLTAEIEKIEYEKKFLESNVSISTHALVEKTIELDELAEENQKLQMSIQKLSTNLTEQLTELAEINEDYKNLDSSYYNLKDELEKHDLLNETVIAIIASISTKLDLMQKKNEKLEQNFNATLEKRDSTAAKIQKDIDFLLEEKKVYKLECESKTKILEASNKKLNTKLTNTVANEAHYEKLKDLFKKSEKN